MRASVVLILVAVGFTAIAACEIQSLAEARRWDTKDIGRAAWLDFAMLPPDTCADGDVLIAVRVQTAKDTRVYQYRIEPDRDGKDTPAYADGEIGDATEAEITACPAETGEICPVVR